MTTPSKAAMDAAELSPCPFCGGSKFQLRFFGEHWVRCSSCYAYGPMCESKAEAIAAWNTRAAAARSAELLEALYVVDRMFSEPGKWNKSSVRDCVRAVINKATGEQP